MIEPVVNQYRPDVVSPPGETLAEILEERGMSQAELAQRMGRPKKTINEIIQGKAAITPETALQLERVLGAPASFWNNREQQYRDYLARSSDRKALADQTGWLERFPVAAMVAFGWIEGYSNNLDQLYELISFFGIASPEQWESVCSTAAFRKTAAFESEPEALSAWLRQGELEAQEVDCRPYNAAQFRQVLQKIRQLTLKPVELYVPELVDLCARAGVAVVFVPQLPTARVSGATRWLTPEKALIQLSLRYKTNDHLWFSFFHEAGHILLHGKREVFLDNEKSARDEEKEQEANDFAARTLIPLAEFKRFRDRLTPGLYPSSTAIIEFAAEIGIAPGIVVGRLQHEGIIPYSHCNDLKERLAWAEPE